MLLIFLQIQCLEVVRLRPVQATLAVVVVGALLDVVGGHQRQFYALRQVPFQA